MRLFGILWFLIGCLSASGQITQEQTRAAVEELSDLIALPNFGLHKKDIEANLAWAEEAFRRRDFRTQRLETSGNALLYAELPHKVSAPTVLFYFHLDGQAVDATRWEQADPYRAVVKRREGAEWQEVSDAEMATGFDPDWRIFGRSASDDKGPIVGFLHGLDALRARNESPRYNIKVILDTEEELGSKPLAAAVRNYRDLLAADALLIHDGPQHLSGEPTIVYGCRGITTLNLTIYGPGTPQHSGHYGNYAPNPIFRMAKLLSSMKDDRGRVLVEGYYDGIELNEATRALLGGVPDDTTAIHRLLQINEPERVGRNYQEALQYPSLNARGIASGYVGAQARTIVPDLATVAIDIRLVPESNADLLIAAIRKHIEEQGYHIVDHEPTLEERLAHPKLLFLYAGGVTAPFRTAMSEPVGEWVSGQMQETFGRQPVRIRMMGGTVPIAAFINELSIPAVIVPMVNPDNNQHSPDENLRIGHLQYSIELFEALFASMPRLR